MWEKVVRDFQTNCSGQWTMGSSDVLGKRKRRGGEIAKLEELILELAGRLPHSSHKKVWMYSAQPLISPFLSCFLFLFCFYLFFLFRWPQLLIKTMRREGKYTQKRPHSAKKWKKPRIPSQKKRRKGKGKISLKFGPFCSHMLFLAQSIFLQTGLFLPTSKSILLFFSFSFDALLRTHICKKNARRPLIHHVQFKRSSLFFSSLFDLISFREKGRKKGKW